jgi:hypothetical protein
LETRKPPASFDSVNPDAAIAPAQSLLAALELAIVDKQGIEQLFRSNLRAGTIQGLPQQLVHCSLAGGPRAARTRLEAVARFVYRLNERVSGHRRLRGALVPVADPGQESPGPPNPSFDSRQLLAWRYSRRNHLADKGELGATPA